MIKHFSLDLIFSASRAGAEAFSWLDPFAVISITDPGSNPTMLRQANIIARCDLQFWDLLDDPGDGRAIFDADMARTVLRFVERDCWNAKMLLIHCEAGISRSAGMANALGRIFGVEARHQNALFLNPNQFVVRILLEEAKRGRTAVQ
jgi:predicted protein tyrosine phosphatase